MRLTILLTTLVTAMPIAAQEFRTVTCEGGYAEHLQGVCADRDSIYWSFTTELVKTDFRGKIRKKIPVVTHHGDLCHHDGKLYVAVNLGKFNEPAGSADSWVIVYNAEDLAFVAKHAVPEVVHGAGGIAMREGKFFVVGGLPEGVKENSIYEYDAAFKFVKKHTLASGHTEKGIQTAALADGSWWFGCYGTPKILLKADAELKKVERFEFECSLGILPLGDGKFLVARGGTDKTKNRTGKLVPAEAHPVKGLKLVEPPKKP